MTDTFLSILFILTFTVLRHNAHTFLHFIFSLLSYLDILAYCNIHFYICVCTHCILQPTRHDRHFSVHIVYFDIYCLKTQCTYIFTFHFLTLILPGHSCVLQHTFLHFIFSLLTYLDILAYCNCLLLSVQRQDKCRHHCISLVFDAFHLHK